jgi:hypothetical protein
MNNQNGQTQVWTIIIVAIIAIGIGYFMGKTNKGLDDINPNPSNQVTNSSSAKQAELKIAMRKLWTDHTVWTRDYIIAAVDNKPDAQAAATRLLKNQEDIGNAVASYYSKDAGDKLTNLLKQHISIAVDLIADAKASNQSKFNADNDKWKANGNEIADFLASANPNWPQATLRDMMAKHLATTTDEVTARLNKKYDDDVRAYDAVYDHILMMSDALSDGIIKQFPDKF